MDNEKIYCIVPSLMEVKGKQEDTVERLKMLCEFANKWELSNEYIKEGHLDKIIESSINLKPKQFKFECNDQFIDYIVVNEENCNILTDSLNKIFHNNKEENRRD